MTESLQSMSAGVAGPWSPDLLQQPTEGLTSRAISCLLRLETSARTHRFPGTYMTSTPTKEQLREYWSVALNDARELDLQGHPPEAVLNLLTDRADHLIAELTAQARAQFERKYAGADDTFAVCATGGYGRRELHPGSDIDLLFLCARTRTPVIESLTETVLYALWDIGLKVGHAVRTVEDCIRIGQEDLTVRTTMMDLRLIAGDRDFFEQAHAALEHRLLHDKLTAFSKAKVAELESRRKRYGETAYVLEPNIKESPGGLRDIQTVRWLTQAAFRVDSIRKLPTLGLMSTEDASRLDDNHGILLGLRTRLHLLDRRSNDQLTLDAQRELAARYGFEDNDRELASEAFMRFYYELSRQTRQLVDIAVAESMDRIVPSSRRLWFRRKRSLGDGFYLYRNQIWGAPVMLRERPALQVLAFVHAQRESASLSLDLKRALIAASPALRTADAATLVEAGGHFLELLAAEASLLDLTTEMNELGVLRALIPEFDHQYCRVQHDTYHIYTADMHLLVCLDVWERLRTGAFADEEPELTHLAETIPDPTVLALAILLHDIGKGYGKDHSEYGAELTEQIARRLGLAPDRARRAAWLVRAHLLLSHTAQRRDLSDHRVIREFAKQIPDPEALDMLLLLTFCDQNGVGPGVWSPWKRSLMLQLHRDSRRVLEREDIQGIHRRRIARSRKALVEYATNEGLADVAHQFVEQMAPRFFVRYDAEEAIDIVRTLARAIADDGPAVSIMAEPDIGGRVVIIAPDAPGVFAFDAGLFSLLDMSIISAEGYTLPDSEWAINIFRVRSRDPLFFDTAERIDRFRDSLLDLLARSDEALAQLERRRQAPPPLPPQSRRRIRVLVDTDLSRRYTVFEILCWDRLGLLHELAEVFSRHACNIWLARIDTEGQRVSDTFYVERGGQPITDSDLLEQLRQDLLAVANRA
ncbi:MAG: [protein-PII] uridylyltransferase [Candidatus Dadabacteria bacterium]|nr:MAG: [protein-PII] uridylyltransferase [Candidatus Dadabacteria bacterium]